MVLTSPYNRRFADLFVCVVLLGTLVGCGGGTGTTAAVSTGGGGTGGGGASGTVGPAFFGMHINNANSPLPGTLGVPISGVRLWDTQTSWATTNTSSGNFNWMNLDFRVNQALNANLDVLYELGRTPAWAQCASSDATCGSGNTTITCAYTTTPGDSTPGDCFPPSDLNVDGSGSDQAWINWVTAVATRYKGQIAYYEIWNEPNISQMWQGTDAQLVRMAADARCIIIGDKGCNSQSTYTQTGIDTSAKMITPAFTYPVNDIGVYLTTVLNGGSGTGSSFADVVAFHGYPGANNPPENVLGIYNSLLGVMSGSQPVFDTEGSWGENAGGASLLTDPDQQAAFTSRYLIVQESAGIVRLYWYAWDLYATDDGDLWAPAGNSLAVNNSGLTEAGVSYQQTESWLSGATPMAQCSENGTVWTCGYTRSGSYQALAVWDESQTCSNGTCGTSTFTVPSSQYTQYQDVAGNTHAINGGTVPIGAKPILLETGNIP
jgi:hypothetical protein